MNRLILSLVCIISLSGIGAASEGPYKLVMSRDRDLCTTMLSVFNQDIDEQGQLRYDHEVFTRISWKTLDLGGRRYECRLIRHSILDINNDGGEDLLIKYSGCLRSQLSDGLFVFPRESDVLSKLKPGQGGLTPLFQTPNKFDRTGNMYTLAELDPAQNEGQRAAIGGVFILQPFIFGKTVYVSMTDLYPEWIVIAKYLKEDHFQDVCYFRGPKFR